MSYFNEIISEKDQAECVSASYNLNRFVAEVVFFLHRLGFFYRLGRR